MWRRSPKLDMLTVMDSLYVPDPGATIQRFRWFGPSDSQTIHPELLGHGFHPFAGSCPAKGIPPEPKADPLVPFTGSVAEEGCCCYFRCTTNGANWGA
jgi:hypothetical protein